MSFPLAPLFSVINNMFQIPFEITSLSGLTQRPLSTLNTEETPDPNMFGLIDLVMAIQEFMTYASVTTNCAILFFTYPNFGEAGFGLEQGTSTVAKLWVIIGIEHALILFKGLLAKCIQDAPAWVVDERESRAQKHIRDSQFLITEGSKRETALKERIKMLNTERTALMTRVAQLSTSNKNTLRRNREAESQPVAIKDPPSVEGAAPAVTAPVIADERPIVRAKERQLNGGEAGKYDGGYDSDMNEWGYDAGNYIDEEEEDEEEGEYEGMDGVETAKKEANHASTQRMLLSSSTSSSSSSDDARNDDANGRLDQERETAAQRAHRHMVQARDTRATSTYVHAGKDDFIRHHMANIGIIMPPAVHSPAKLASHTAPPVLSKTAGRDMIATLLEKRRRRKLLPLRRPPDADEWRLGHGGDGNGDELPPMQMSGSEMRALFSPEKRRRRGRKGRKGRKAGKIQLDRD